MKEQGFITSRHASNLFLVSALLAGLSLAYGANQVWSAQISNAEVVPAQPSISSAAALLRTHLLTTDRRTRSENHASKQSQSRQPTTHSAIGPAKFAELNAIARQLSFGRAASVAHTAFCFSWCQGRAPPYSA
jgi:predicted lipid-binding transport protein (Tim44 family)